MLRSSLVFLSALSLRSVAALVSNGIIFPLFVYPGEGCSSWSALNSAISNNPSVPFIVVVNPNSGPGDSGSQPDSNYQSCIPKLSASGSSQNSVTLVGYVDTNYGSRSSNDVLADINTYGQWSSSYKLQGVYLDRTAATSQFESAYRSYASQAQQAFGSAYVVMDTGTIPSDISFFTFANLLVTFTNVYSSFSSSQLTISDAAPAQKQAVILYSGPSTTPETLVKQLVQMGIGSMFITDASNFERPPNDLGGLVSDVKGASDSGSGSGSNPASGTVTSANSGNTAVAGTLINSASTATATGTTATNISGTRSGQAGSPSATGISGSKISSSGTKVAGISDPSSSASSTSSVNTIPPIASAAKKSKTGAIVAGILVPIIVIAILAIVLQLLRRRRANLSAAEPFQSDKLERGRDEPDHRESLRDTTSSFAPVRISSVDTDLAATSSSPILYSDEKTTLPQWEITPSEPSISATTTSITNGRNHTLSVATSPAVESFAAVAGSPGATTSPVTLHSALTTNSASISTSLVASNTLFAVENERLRSENEWWRRQYGQEAVLSDSSRRPSVEAPPAYPGSSRASAQV